MQQDIIVIGAGPAGLCFARSLATSGLKITMIERSDSKTLSNPPYDGREIALTHLSHKLLNDLDMWQRIPDGQHFRIRDAKVVNGDSPYSLNFDHRETGQENLGFMVSNSTIRQVAYQSVAECKNITLLTDKEVRDIGTDARHGWVELADGERLTAKLVVAADSRFSATRQKMGISTSMLDFGRTCVVCTMAATQPHDDTAVEYFHYGRTLAILPLNDNQVSVVITIKADAGADVLAMDDAEFSADISRRADKKFGDMTLTSERFTYPLVATFAQSFYMNRYALVGDAAVGMHPVTAHGFNLGLQGGATLAREIMSAKKRGQDFADSLVLKRYNTQHRRASLPIYHGTNALVRLYTNDTAPARLARDTLLRVGNALTPARNLIIDRLTELKSIEPGP